MGRSADQAISVGWLNVQSLRNKTDAVEELVRDRSLDVLALTETWHTDSDVGNRDWQGCVSVCHDRNAELSLSAVRLCVW